MTFAQALVKLGQKTEKSVPQLFREAGIKVSYKSYTCNVIHRNRLDEEHYAALLETYPSLSKAGAPSFTRKSRSKKLRRELKDAASAFRHGRLSENRDQQMFKRSCRLARAGGRILADPAMTEACLGLVHAVMDLKGTLQDVEYVLSGMPE